MSNKIVNMSQTGPKTSGKHCLRCMFTSVTSVMAHSQAANNMLAMLPDHGFGLQIKPCQLPEDEPLFCGQSHSLPGSTSRRGTGLQNAKQQMQIGLPTCHFTFTPTSTACQTDAQARTIYAYTS